MDRVLLVESGSRTIAERLRPGLLRNHGSGIKIDLFTCYPGLPSRYPEDTAVFRTQEHPDRKALLRQLCGRGYSLVGVICSGEPILFKWKLVLAARVPAKVFIVNENADYFWLDYGHWRLLARMAAHRLGLSGPSAARNLAGIALFPLTLAYLLAYAVGVHSVRLVRLAARRI